MMIDLGWFKSRLSGMRARLRSKRARETFLKGARGVIHVGANTGQERHVYARLGLPVVWIEPIPAVFQQLLANIAPFPAQRAISALITDQDGERITLNIASNGGASSSILALADHSDVWPDVVFTGSVELISQTLPAALETAGVDPAGYDVLVMDTQGSELMVLQGARPLLGGLRTIKTEAADFEAYAGCARVAEIEAFLAGAGFVTQRKDAFAHRSQGGAYYDLLFTRPAVVLT
jgi:FkbM family methyltransferase